MRMPCRVVPKAASIGVVTSRAPLPLAQGSSLTWTVRPWLSRIGTISESNSAASSIPGNARMSSIVAGQAGSIAGLQPNPMAASMALVSRRRSW